jgi:hypothetical protein
LLSGNKQSRWSCERQHAWPACGSQQQGKQYAARNTLSETYNWFTEGFDTKDLQEAKGLLDELSH